MNAPLWLREEGPDSDVVLSTRCRIARNLESAPFPWRANELQRKFVSESLRNAAERAGGPLRDAESIAAGQQSPEEINRLVEWRYASRTWAEGGSHRWLVGARDGILSLLINEEDHLRIQAISPGFLVESCTSGAQDIERALSLYVPFARHDRIGYLTSALTNAGTGIRVSVFVHLSALMETGDLEPRLATARELGATVRGLFGEGTSGEGGFFQISNRRAFDLHPQDIVSGVTASARMLVNAEREARRALYGSHSGRLSLAEEVYSSLTEIHRRDPSPTELLTVVSILRMGVAEGLVPASLAATAEWVSLAGLSAAFDSEPRREVERFEAARRSATLRQRLRGILERPGTFTG